MKRIRKLKLILIGLIGGIFIMSGCLKAGKSKEEIVKEALKTKYNEEFIVHSISNLSGGMDAIVSPENNPEIVFSVRIEEDATYISDSYYKGYLDFKLREKLTQDLEPFFPDAYIKVDSHTVPQDTNIAFREMSLKDLIENMKEGTGNSREAYVSIYVNGEVGTGKNYENEYIYFTDTLKEYVDNKEMIPIILEFYWVDKQTEDKVATFFSAETEIDDYFIDNIIKSDDYLKTIRNKEDVDPGNPRSIVVCFGNDSWEELLDYEEYVRRREILENGKLL